MRIYAILERSKKMAKSLDSVMKSLPAERRKKIEARGQELIDEVLTLQSLRKELDLTKGIWLSYFI